MKPYATICCALRMYRDRHLYDLSIQAICKLAKISKSTLYEWRNKFMFSNIIDIDTYDNEIRPYWRALETYPKIYTDACIQFIINLLAKNPQTTNKKIKLEVKKIFKIQISKQHLSRIIKKNNITRKRISTDSWPSKTKHDYSLLVNNLKKQIEKARCNFVSIDEIGIHTRILPNYGYSKKGKKCIVKEKTQVKSIKYSLALAITKKRVLSWKLIDGGFKKDVFLDFIKNDVVPKTKKAILMDNVRMHNLSFDYLYENKRHYIRNVPYRPQFNPIELLFNKLKTDLSKHIFETKEQINKLLKKFFRKISSTEIENYYQHALKCLYSVTD